MNEPIERPVWAAMLAKLVAPMEAERAAKALADMLPMLNLPREAFTIESLRAIAQEGRKVSAGEYAPLTRVPTYGELEAALWRFWGDKTEREKPVMIACERPPTKENPSPEVCQQVAGVVHSFVGERSFSASTAPARKRVAPHHLSDGQLDIAYQKAGVPNPRTIKMDDFA